ncbi:MAG: DUF4440 domain-containing protein [Caulobacteraceae bacterium]
MNHQTTPFARAIVAAAALAALAACAPRTATAPAVDTSKDVAALKAAAADFNAAYKARAADKLSAMDAPDLIAYFPSAPVQNGPGDAKAQAAQFAADPAMSVVITPDRTEVAKSGDLAYAVGHAEASNTNPKTHAVEHNASGYVAVFRKQADGSWKTIAVAVSPTPAAPAAPAKP